MPLDGKLSGLLLDMDGVFYVGDQLIPGAIDTLNALREAGLPYRFITNTTTKTRGQLQEKLKCIGIETTEDELFTAVSATKRYLRNRGNPTCHFLVRGAIKTEFSDFETDQTNPDYVVIGDIGASWNYDTLNSVFNMLMRGSRLICMHRNKYWQDQDGLRMDIGAFVAALEYVSSKEALVVGKPSSAFFAQALAALGQDADSVAIVGDDIESDVGGGQAYGLQGILVKTGKYRPELATRSPVKPDLILDSIADLPEALGIAEA